MKALVIDNDSMIEDCVSLALKAGWPESKYICADSHEEGILSVEKESPDIIIIDHNPPNADGFPVIQDIRLFSDVPIMVISDKLDELSIAKGLDLGADEYIARSFGQLELIYRVRALLRRYHSSKEGFPLACGGLCLYSSTAELVVGKKKINLTRTESIILGTLMRNVNNCVTYEGLSNQIWGDDHLEYKNTIRNYIWHIREKLKRYGYNGPLQIESKPTIGYTLHELN